MKVEQMPNPINIYLDALEAAKLKAILGEIGRPDEFILELYGALDRLPIEEWCYEWQITPCLR